MSARRRPLHRDDLNIETTLRRALDVAPAIELGWSLLRQELADAGWPATTPDDDRHAPTSEPATPEPDTPMAWRCDCGNMFTTETEATDHLQRSAHIAIEHVTTGHGTTGVDHTDRTGEQALHFNRMTGDLETLETHWHLVRTSLRAITAITRKYIPPATPAIPACSITTCDDHVEYTPNGGYRGMELIVGHWVAKPGTRPVCARHRSVQRRDIA